MMLLGKLAEVGPGYCYALNSSMGVLLYLGHITGIAYCISNYQTLMNILRLQFLTIH